MIVVFSFWVRFDLWSISSRSEFLAERFTNELLKNYFHTRVEMLKIEFPELVKSYTKVFR